ncbi:MAG: hypothetical protein ACTSYA_08530 [Candidatus Kariarchaeaceae archaeon]
MKFLKNEKSLKNGFFLRKIILIMMVLVLSFSVYAACPDNMVSYWQMDDGYDGITLSENINQETNWDTNHVYGPSVLKDGSTYHM